MTLSKTEPQTAIETAETASAEPIYFARPSAQYQAMRAEIDAAIRRVLDGHAYIMGPEVVRFETGFAAYTGAAHAVGVANGTDALHLALRALEIGAGDEVIVPAHTAVPTAAAIEMSGAVPRFVDITADRYGLDPALVERAIGPRTRAIMPVHLYGHPADLGPLLELAQRRGLKLIEDAAQAHGARWRGRQVGSIGDIGCFSLYPTKNLGAIGDAGIVTTNDAGLAQRLRMLRQYGWRDRQLSELPGFNSRLDELQAAILNVKLAHLDAGNARRRAIAARYLEAFGNLPMALPHVQPGCEAVYHLFVVRTPQRDALKTHLQARGVIAGIHYPVPCHRHPAYRDRFGDVRLPVTEQVVGEILSLPMYPELTDDQVGRVIDAVRSFFVG
ncbi:MAG TPA: DegT/DnrJ/EryC1/StrS family aminotransferase [Candidatus Sulfotelmatobacter sp.]|nr:DegT/DnrJ/EryC1/StrS family aminotransferase [Candidatus Sulfotelmatobacter sp.]